MITGLVPDFSLIPIQGGIDYPEAPQIWSEAVPATTVKPSLLTSVLNLKNQIEPLFDAGWSVYEKITGRMTANELIAKETVSADPTPIILQQSKGFYELYNENKMAVMLVGGGLVLLTMALLFKKV